MYSSYLKYSQELIVQGRPFVVAIVVSYQGPISGKPGDKAIVTNDGKIWGWVAGGCSQSIIIKEALNVLNSGKPKLIKITPDPMDANDNIEEHKMTCHSGGTLEVFLEPIVPKPLVMILGNSAVAGKLEILANALQYEVTRETAVETSDRLVNIVVATQGEGDELAVLEQALSIKSAYIGFVSSHKKGESLKQALAEKGISRELLEGIKAPAGLDIKARSPEEIALSILAEIVMINRSKIAERKPKESMEMAIDPICGMKVKIEGARHLFEYRGTNYYFCCEGCRNLFEKEPGKYLSAAN